MAILARMTALTAICKDRPIIKKLSKMMLKRVAYGAAKVPLRTLRTAKSTMRNIKTFASCLYSGKRLFGGKNRTGLARREGYPVARLLFLAAFVNDRFHKYVMTKPRDSSLHQIDQRPPVAIPGMVGGKPESGQSLAFDDANFIRRYQDEIRFGSSDKSDADPRMSQCTPQHQTVRKWHDGICVRSLHRHRRHQR
ncbi:hypothetical protein MFFC18_00780 [Mariniblastus fucicola]|uniref:Uncharacterized protein n=1 Tax=Mariniblastus fucicola TaxID=980251 RepID=A0A5B9PAU1_9BACT|nr:hypothetical protein MFFC18_00780 [Mariniblastus fucicola]